MMIKKGGLFAAAALVVLLAATSHSFSFVPQGQQQRCSSALHAEQDNSSQESSTSVSTRRGFFSQVAATASASLLLSASPQQATAADSNEPTRIELSVDTEYMIRVLDYFDGDMRKVIEVLIRAPSTEVEIETPASRFDTSAKDAILSAISSYSADPEQAARQASWIKVDEPNRTLDFLLKKRYNLSVPSAGSQDAQEIEIVLKDGGTLKYKPMKLDSTPFSLSNLEAAVGLAVASYPVAYGVYNYDSWKEEQDKKEKRKQMAAKKAAKAKAAAAKAKSKGTKKKKEKKTKANTADDTAEKYAKQVMKGQEKKTPKVDNSPVDVNFDGKSEEWFLSEATLKSAIEKPKPSADANDGASKGSEWFGRDVSESTVMAMVEEAETVLQEIAQQGGYLDNLSPPSPKRQVTSKKQVAAKKVFKKSGSFSSYLDSL